MPVKISVGSGKGGVGKSVLSTNIAYLLGKAGLSVTLLDMDSGGADLHILMGLFRPKYTLTDFIEKRVDSLNDVAQKLEGFNKIKIITGTGDSLHTANMPSATKSKLLRHIQKIDSDVVIIDVGAGTHFNTLDFFIAADIQVCVTTGDPTAILDLYRFIKLAVIRKALSSFLAYDEVSKVIRKRDIKDIGELLVIASEYGEDRRQSIDNSIAELNPCIVFNQVDATPNAKFSRLKSLLLDYLKITNLDLLGKVPDDPELRKSVKVYQPITSLKPAAPSSLALEVICSRLLKHIDRLQS